MGEYKDLTNSVRLLSNMKDPLEGHGCEFKVRPAKILVGFFLVIYSCTVGCGLAKQSERGARLLRIYAQSNYNA